MNKTIYTNFGADFEETFLYKNANGTPKDLTGYTSNIKVAKYFGAKPVITITGTVQIPATNGIVIYNAPKEIFLSFGFGTFFYTRYLYDSTGKIQSVITGDFVIIPNIV